MSNIAHQPICLRAADLTAQGGSQGIEVFGDQVPVPLAFKICRLPKTMFGWPGDEDGAQADRFCRAKIIVVGGDHRQL